MRKNSVYEIAREMAMNNDNDFHLAAILWRNGKLIRIGINGKSSSRFWRHFSPSKRDKVSQVSFVGCAESDALLEARPGDTLEVLRWTSDGNRNMACPCRFCKRLIIQKQIASVRYTDWDGKWTNL